METTLDEEVKSNALVTDTCTFRRLVSDGTQEGASVHSASLQSRRALGRAHMPISKDAREIVCRSILGTLPNRVCSRFDAFDVPLLESASCSLST